MNYSDRKQTVVWTSPLGKVFNLKTKVNSYNRKHNGEVNSSPSTDKQIKRINDSTDTFKDLGVSGKSINLEFLFIGENHDTESENFENALCEKGQSKLRLFYGAEFTVNVIDFPLQEILNRLI